MEYAVGSGSKWISQSQVPFRVYGREAEMRFGNPSLRCEVIINACSLDPTVMEVRETLDDEGGMNLASLSSVLVYIRSTRMIPLLTVVLFTSKVGERWVSR